MEAKQAGRGNWGQKSIALKSGASGICCLGYIPGPTAYRLCDLGNYLSEFVTSSLKWEQ